MTTKLEAARIKSLPEDAFYIPNFVSEDEEAYLLQRVTTAPLSRWTNLTHRRLQTYPSQLVTTKTNTNALLSAPLPRWLTTPIIHPRFDDLGIFAAAPHKAPNHVLVNEYRPGQGIMPHQDGPAYFPVVATVSLGGVGVLDVYEKVGEGGGSGGGMGGGDEDGDERRRRPRFRILQEPRSLLVTRGRLYTDYLHGIAETSRDEGLDEWGICNWDLLGDKEAYSGSGSGSGLVERGTRISLTYRDVLRVVTLGNTMKFLGPR